MRKYESTISILFLIFLYFYMLSCNFMMPLLADDYNYSFIFGTEQFITTFNDLLISQYNHYMTWGGRTIAITLTQGFLALDKIYFNYWNAFIFILLLLLIYWVYRGEKPTFRLKAIPLFFVFFFTWTCVKAFGENILWLCGSCVYLWPMTFILMFLLPYRLHYKNPQKFNVFDKFYFSPIIFLLGILAGWSNENTGLSMLLITASTVFYFHRTKQLKPWMFVGLVGAFIGYVLLLAAPGNYAKAALTVHKESYTFWKQIEHAFLMQFKIMLAQIAAWVPIFYCLLKIKNNKASRIFHKEFHFSIAFIFLSIVNNLVMIASPDFPNRAAFGSSIYLIIGAMGLFRIFHEAYHFTFFSVALRKAGIATLFLFLIASMGFTLQDYTVIHRESLQRVQYVNTQTQLGNYDMILAPYSVESSTVFKHVFIRDISKNPNYWTNDAFKQYYNLNSIRLSDEK